MSNAAAPHTRTPEEAIAHYVSAINSTFKDTLTKLLDITDQEEQSELLQTVLMNVEGGIDPSILPLLRIYYGKMWSI